MSAAFRLADAREGAYIIAMSRLRRPFLYERFLFVTVEYIHLNPVRRKLVRRPEDWRWSSMLEFAGVSGEEQERRCGLRIDRVTLPFDLHARI